MVLKADVEPKYNGVIFSESKTNASSFDGQDTEKMPLALAIAGATGISFGVAPLIAHLLMPELFEPGQFQSLLTDRHYEISECGGSIIRLSSEWRSDCRTTLMLKKPNLSIQKVEETLSPTLEEKQRGIGAMGLPEGSELEEIKALSLQEVAPSLMSISYTDVKFDLELPQVIFTSVR